MTWNVVRFLQGTKRVLPSALAADSALSSQLHGDELVRWYSLIAYDTAVVSAR